MKQNAKSVLKGLLVVLLSATLSVPVWAFSEVGYLFAEGLHESESLQEEKKIENNGFNLRYRDETTVWYEVPYVVRPMTVSARVHDRDVKVMDFVHIVVPENKTLTIDEGMTMVVHGSLMIEGKLLNKGTIIVGDRSVYEQRSPKYGESQIVVKGQFINNGTMSIECGAVFIEAEASLENRGTIDIANKSEKVYGLVNANRATRSSILGGYILNTGVINVFNEGGYGLRNYKGATVDNQGKIYKSAGGGISGTITGNAPTAMTLQ